MSRTELTLRSPFTLSARPSTITAVRWRIVERPQRAAFVGLTKCRFEKNCSSDVQTTWCSTCHGRCVTFFVPDEITCNCSRERVWSATGDGFSAYKRTGQNTPGGWTLLDVTVRPPHKSTMHSKKVNTRSRARYCVPRSWTHLATSKLCGALRLEQSSMPHCAFEHGSC